MTKKKLTKSNDKVFSGVLAGIAEYFDWSPTLVRVIFVALSIFTTGFPGILVYLILMLVIPDAPKRQYSAEYSEHKRKVRKDVTNSSDTKDDNWSDY